MKLFSSICSSTYAFTLRSFSYYYSYSTYYGGVEEKLAIGESCSLDLKLKILEVITFTRGFYVS